VDSHHDNEQCMVSRRILELAFNAEGTDHDVIAVPVR